MLSRHGGWFVAITFCALCTSPAFADLPESPIAEHLADFLTADPIVIEGGTVASDIRQKSLFTKNLLPNTESPDDINFPTDAALAEDLGF